MFHLKPSPLSLSKKVIFPFTLFPIYNFGLKSEILGFNYGLKLFYIILRFTNIMLKNVILYLKYLIMIGYKDISEWNVLQHSDDK